MGGEPRGAAAAGGGSMGDGDLPPLEHVRAGIEAVHDEAEKPPDRQPRASRQGPPRHLRCAGTTTVAAAESRSTGPTCHLRSVGASRGAQPQRA
jgi:hypothetical protein